MGGTTWTQRDSLSTSLDWTSIAYGNGTFVAVASSNGVITSPDAVTWTSQSAFAKNWTSVTYGNSTFVAVSNTTTNSSQVMTSPDGVTWTLRTSSATQNWNSVTYGNGLFVAVSSSGTGTRVMTSPDGATWTTRTSAADQTWLSVTYGNGLFVAVSSSGTGTRAMSSPDGITWTLRSSAADNVWTSVTHGSGRFVAVSASGSGNRVMSSENGMTWTIRTSAADRQWRSVCYGNGLFVAVGDDGTTQQAMTSPDGITWTLQTTSTGGRAWQEIVWGEGIYAAVGFSNGGSDSLSVMTSPGDDPVWDSVLSEPDAYFGPGNVWLSALVAAAANFDSRNYNNFATASAAFSASLDAAKAGDLSTNIYATTSVSASVIAHLFAAINATAPLSSTIRATVNYTDAAQFAAALNVLQNASLTASANFAATLTPSAIHINELVEAVIVSGLASDKVTAISLLSTSAALGSNLTAFIPVSASVSAVFSASLADRVVAYNSLITSAVLAEQLGSQATAVVAVTGSASMLSSLTSTLRAAEYLVSSMDAEVCLLLNGQAYTGWAVNADTGAPSQYENFNFNSMARLGQRYYGANQDGLFELDGDLDNADPIAASVLTGQLDFGSMELKRVQDVYLGYTSDGDLVMKVVANVGGRRVENWYQAQTPVGVDRPGRVVLGRGVESRYWQFELVNESGADFELDRMDLNLIHLSRRV